METAHPDISVLLRQLVDGQTLNPQLFEICRQLAIKQKNKIGEKQKDTPDGLALSFLLDLFSSGNIAIKTKSGLNLQFNRFCSRRTSPAFNELWRILSKAINNLIELGKVRRLGKENENIVNSNESIFTAFGAEQDQCLFNITDFEKRASEIGQFYPDKNSDDAQRTHKVLSPPDAELLCIQILDAAAGPIRFEELFNEAKKHVFVFFEVAPPVKDDDEADSDSSSHWVDTLTSVDPDVRYWLYEEATGAVKRIWEGLKKHEITHLLCGYFLPKYVRDEKCSLEKFGAPQRINEKVNLIKKILAAEMHVQRLNRDSNDANHLAIRCLSGFVLDELSEKCSEKP